MNGDIVGKLREFLALDPKELVKRYPGVDPNKMLSELQSQGIGAGMQMGGQGFQSTGAPFAGVATPDTGLLRAFTSAPPQGGQGFQQPQAATNPWVPQAQPMDLAGGMQPQGLKVAGGAMLPQAAAPGVPPGLIPAALNTLMASQPQQTPPPPAAPMRVSPGGGQRAEYVMSAPELQQMQQQLLAALLKGSPYA